MPHGRTLKFNEREIRKCLNFLTQNETCLIDILILEQTLNLWKVLLPRYFARNVTQLPRGGEGYSPMNWRGCLSGNFENTPKRYQNLVLWACHLVTNSFSPLRRTNSTTTNNITGTANFNSNKDNFRTLCSQGRFESIVINLCPNQSF